MSDPAVETWREATAPVPFWIVSTTASPHEIPVGPCPRGFKCGGDQEAGDCRCIESAEYGPDTYNFDPPWVP